MLLVTHRTLLKTLSWVGPAFITKGSLVPYVVQQHINHRQRSCSAAGLCYRRLATDWALWEPCTARVQGPKWQKFT